RRRSLTRGTRGTTATGTAGSSAATPARAAAGAHPEVVVALVDDAVFKRHLIVVAVVVATLDRRGLGGGNHLLHIRGARGGEPNHVAKADVLAPDLVTVGFVARNLDHARAVVHHAVGVRRCLKEEPQRVGHRAVDMLLAGFDRCRAPARFAVDGRRPRVP